MTEDQLYDLSAALRHAQSYLRKMKQWKDGKIDLTVEGCDAPYMMGDEELLSEQERVWGLIEHVDSLLSCDS